MKKTLVIVLVLLGLLMAFVSNRPETGLERTMRDAVQRDDARAELAEVPRTEPESSDFPSLSDLRAAIPTPAAPRASTLS